MPPPSGPPLPKPAQPRHGRNFDPWNAASLGHQRAETKGPQGWRENRTWKLHSQLAAGNTGGARLADAVGLGSEDFDEERGVLVPREVRARAADSVMDMLRRPGSMRASSRRGWSTEQAGESPERVGGAEGGAAQTTAGEGDNNEDDEGGGGSSGGGGGSRGHESARRQDQGATNTTTTSSKIFSGLVIYVNGSTHPLVSDHKLKHILVEHGARMSIHLGRRQVTHVILGRPAGPNGGGSGGAGGGLAGGKLEKEVRRVGGRGVKFVGVEWVLESLKAGRRLPEARFANLKVASKGQTSVLGAFTTKPAS